MCSSKLRVRERKTESESEWGEGGVDKERSDKEGEKNAIWCRNGKRMESVSPRGPETLLIL